MDKGAHFYKCDFQVHTPRDARWGGRDATTPDERKAYAEELIRACRVKRIGAIAVTDHHDFAFFPFIKNATEAELDDNGKPIAAENILVVCPGLELTLAAPPCQAILILDADFPENLLHGVLTTLGITPNGHDQSKHATIQAIPKTVSGDFAELYQKLNNLDYLQNRFIIFPNVTDRGHKTLLRKGFAGYYKSMPCVGGYVDGLVSKQGRGSLSIVNGTNRDYGFKSIAVFQTSDNRTRDHSSLGECTTWFKWSEPTAEALRQACLAKQSRMSQDEPELPNLWITSVSVSNSKFLGKIGLELNQQYDAIIGGRGTGKSTILEYLRWGLCDQPVENYESDIAPVQSKRKKLIDDTLLKFDGEIRVTFILNGVYHIVKRNSKTQEILLKIGEADFIRTTEQEVRNLLPIQAYSQKQLSSVGIRAEELKRFVELPVKKDLDQLRSDIRDVSAKVRIAYAQVIRKRAIETEINKYSIEIESLSRQLIEMREGLKGLSKEDQETIGQKAKYDNEEVVVIGLNNELERVHTLISNLAVEFTGILPGQEAIELQNDALIKDIRDKFSSKFAQIKTKTDELSELFSVTSLKELSSKVAEWEKVKTTYDKEYEAAKVRAKVNQQQLKQIEDAEKRATELRKLQQAHKNTLSTLGDPESQYKIMKQKWETLHTEKVNILDRQCKQFSQLSSGLIKADILKSFDVDLLKQHIRSAFSGMNIKEQKIDDICQCVLEATSPLTVWGNILTELEKLALHNAKGTDPLPATPTLNKCGFIESERKRIAGLFNAEKWLDLSVAELEFNPIFRYCTNPSINDYIEFSDASAGQQATALLTVLLNQQGAPLIIDQPEDDIDSKLIKDIIEGIWRAKKKRQLIFASHNANFVVNGDAELVVCFDYTNIGSQTGGGIKLVGAIDSPKVKREITVVTEGGEEAFKLRMKKYGF